MLTTSSALARPPPPHPQKTLFLNKYSPTHPCTFTHKLAGNSKVRALRQDMGVGSFAVRWALPPNANSDSLRADYKDGLLHISLSKRGMFTLL
jgi:hypothetical protein